MKIQLERKLPSCPNQLRCAVCSQMFASPRVRNLLCSDRGLIQGDVCSICLMLKPSGIKQKLREQSRLLIEQAELKETWSDSPFQPAAELFECSEEDIKLPTVYQRLLKRIEIFAQESQELEAARFGLSNCSCDQKSRLHLIFMKDADLD